MTRRIDISSEREIAALRSIGNALSNARPPSRFLRLRPHTRTRARVEATLTNRIDRDAAPAARKAFGYAYLALLEERFGALPSDTSSAPAVAIDAFIFDRSALLALAHGHTSARRYFERAIASGTRIIAPATVLLDTRAFDVCRDVATIVDIVPIDATIATAAARLMVEARLNLPLDALTVACVPAGNGAVFVTSDGPGIGTLVRATQRADYSVWLVGR